MAGICNADCWYYVAEHLDTKKVYVWPIAVWVIDDDGDVQGYTGGTTTSDSSKHGYLFHPPCDVGTYKHLSELTDAEINAARGGVEVCEK